MRGGLGSIVVVLAVAAAGADGAEQVPDRAGLNAPWQLERITLDDGRTLEGLVSDEGRGGDDIAFVEVVRRPGRPMYLVARRLPAGAVASIERLPDAAHAALVARVEAFRASDRAREERAPATQLVRDGEDAPWRYEGPWFTSESTAGQALTRRALVRLESLLAAFEGLVPAAGGAADRRLAVRLCGSQADYMRVQAAVGVKAANPAFYLPARSLLVAGSDATTAFEEARLAADGLDATLDRQRALDADVATGLRALARELESQGVPASQRADIVARTRARWQRENAATLARVEQARKDNSAVVDRAERALFTALAHEAWHAYADLRLGAGGGLPAWLDEGLAQVFETGLLEAGELRLDAPDPARLARLAALLDTTPAPLLDGLVADGERQFVVGHGTPAAAARQAYLLAWGVAYDLALGAPVLSARSLAGLAGADDGRARFERLVGTPLAEYEAAWRARMRSLSRQARAAQPRGDQAAARPLPASGAAAPAAPGR